MNTKIGSGAHTAITLSIKWKLIGIMTVLIVCLTVILAYMQISSQTRMLEDALNKRIALMKENLIVRGKSMIINLSEQVENDIAAFNFSGAMEAVSSRVDNNAEILYAMVMSSDGMALIDTRDAPEASEFDDRTAVFALEQTETTVKEYTELGAPVIEIIQPIQISTEPWGVLRLMYTLEHLEQEIQLSRKQIRQEIRGMVYRSAITASGFLLVSLVFVYVLSTSFSRPLIHLTQSARQLSKGDFSVSSTIQIRSHDEVGVLAATFIDMSNELKDSYEKLEEYNRTLEHKVAQRTKDLAEKNAELGKTLDQLKSTQDQLIVSEKLASLGALTAGIAHEIKNPLNFVTNFAQLTIELVQDLITQIEPQKAHMDENAVQEIDAMLGDITQTADKINQHGQRADRIVAGMLAHSREDPGARENVNVNVLLDEYVNLAYHGIRAKNSRFNVTIERNYDTTIGPVSVVAQDMSRVFLNIMNNACYAVDKKKHDSDSAYSPTIWVSSTHTDDAIEVRIRDNGIGIAPDVAEQIFNPFFTTKPTGEGTGLGLSISYDIVVHEHQGELRVESEEGEFAEFVVNIPKQ